MTRFNINVEYRTAFGEELYLITEGSHPQAIAMRWADDAWHCSVESELPSITYRFEHRCNGQVARREWGKPHHHAVCEGVAVVDIHTHWRDIPADNALYSSMFCDGILRRSNRNEMALPAANSVTICAEIPGLTPAQHVLLVGDGEALGNWISEEGVTMHDGEFPRWSVTLDKAALPRQFSFKFVIVDAETYAPQEWERGDEHHIDLDDAADCTIIDGLRPRFGERQPWRGAGTAIPLFSLRSNESCGVGDFYDLKLLVDWAARTGQSIIQILPINDTTMTGTQRDSYPYNACSSFALHPQYIRLEAVGRLRYRRRMSRLNGIKRQLNALADIDYEAVNRTKVEYLRAIFKQDYLELHGHQEFQQFVAKNRSWLLPYSIYCTLRDERGSADFSQWGEYATYADINPQRFIDAHPNDILFHCFVQYHLDKQLREVRDYAHSRGVVLKGDIPIGISPTSVDAWVHPELFNMSVSAGAPPDDFSVLGQDWGFPTYNWQRMAEDGYAWWRARFAKMAEYFDAYRIDHILGFFRIWEIPHRSVNALLGHFNPALPLSEEEICSFGFRFDKASHTAPLDVTDNVLFVEDESVSGHYHPRITAQKTAVYAALSDEQKEAYNNLYNDFFYHRHNAFWYDEAKRKLPTLIASTDMLVCGEDLGMIPDCVAAVMAEEQILSLEIQRMPKAYGVEFGDPRNYGYLAVCTTSTHDMNPVRAWWEEDYALSQRFFESMLGKSGTAPKVCDASICREIIEQHLASPAMLTILPWQDWMAMEPALRRENPAEERINIPADSQHYWRYRMHLTLEELLEADTLNDTIAEMIRCSGRK